MEQTSRHPKATDGWAVISVQGGDSDPLYTVQAAIDPYTEKRRTVEPLPPNGIMIGFHAHKESADREAKAANRTRRQRFGYDHDAASR